MAFIDFMSSGSGRAARVVVGLAMVVVGFSLGGGWVALSIVGLVPLAAGALRICLAAPLFHQPLHTTGSAEK